MTKSVFQDRGEETGIENKRMESFDCAGDSIPRESSLFGDSRKGYLLESPMKEERERVGMYRKIGPELSTIARNIIQ